jgi:hypothetical protein
MILVLCLRWWYGAGWQWVWRCVLIDRLKWVMETFSAKDLLRTLFAPYRQTFAGKVKGSIGDKFRAMIDTLISRVIGLLVRLVLLFMAMIGAVVVTLVAFTTLLLWPLIPVLSVLSIAAMIAGVGV